MKGFGILIIIAVIVGGGYLLTRDSNVEVMEKENITDDESMMMSSEYEGVVLAGKDAPLLDFTQRDYEEALQGDKLIVLYFYATWCPYCKAEAAGALEPAFNAFDRDDVIGFRVNYNDGDTDEYETALAREHGVAYQHTKVFIKDGERILKAPDTWDKMRYDTEIANALK